MLSIFFIGLQADLTEELTVKEGCINWKAHIMDGDENVFFNDKHAMWISYTFLNPIYLKFFIAVSLL